MAGGLKVLTSKRKKFESFYHTHHRVSLGAREAGGHRIKCKEGMMNKYFTAAGIIVLTICFFFAGQGFSETIVIEDTKGDVPIIIKKDDISMVPVDQVGGEKPENKCVGWTYGTYYTTADNALRVNKIVIEPNGKIGTHDGPHSYYICLVVEGEGVLTLVDANNKPCGTFNWKPDDVIVFRANTLHRWDNGDKQTVMIGVEKVP